MTAPTQRAWMRSPRRAGVRVRRRATAIGMCAGSAMDLRLVANGLPIALSAGRPRGRDERFAAARFAAALFADDLAIAARELVPEGWFARALVACHGAIARGHRFASLHDRLSSCDHRTALDDRRSGCRNVRRRREQSAKPPADDRRDDAEHEAEDRYVAERADVEAR